MREKEKKKKEKKRNGEREFQVSDRRIRKRP